MSRKLRMLWSMAFTLVFGLSTATAQTVYVDADATGPHDGTTWCNAFLTLQDALGVAVPGDAVRVADGTYMPDGGYTPAAGAHVAGSGDRTATFQLISGVILEGGYAGCGAGNPDERNIVLHVTILSGDLIGNDVAVSDPIGLPSEPTRAENSYHIVIGSGTDDTAVLSGFTITGGNANGTSGNDVGAGMSNIPGSPTVVNCNFVHNSAANGHAGVDNRSGSQPLFRNCKLIGNVTQTHDGGAMGNFNSASPTLVNCLFSGNYAGSGGGGMNNESNSSPTLENCTFYGNTAAAALGGTDGGGIWNESGSNPTLTNCILWGNSDSGGSDESAQIHNTGGSAPIVTYSCIQGLVGGGDLDDGTNIGNNPMFVDADGDDSIAGTEDDNLHLDISSPCIDAGSNVVVTEATDLDGNLRIVDGDADGTATVDMGAYEFQVGAVPAVSEWGLVAMTLLFLTAGTLVYARRRPAQA